MSRQRRIETAAQKVREARSELNDIPRSERTLPDHLILFLLGISEEYLSNEHSTQE